MFKSLSLESGKAFGVVDGRINTVLDAGVFFGVVPAIQCTNEVAGDTAEAFEFAFVEVFGVSVEILLGGSVASFIGEELSAGFDKAGNVQSIVMIEVGESFLCILFGNFGVPSERFSESFDVKILSV